MNMTDDIVSLLRLFEEHVPDKETNRLVLLLATEDATWPEAHELFNRIRRRTLEAISAGDHRRECQYCFEEICLKCLYNETGPADPFDSDSPHWITKNAVSLARRLNIAVQSVVDIISPVTSV